MENYPIHYYKLDVREYKGFLFPMPEHDAGRDDILIFVEYGENVNNPKETVYQAWGQRKDHPTMRCLVSDGTVPTKSLKDNAAQAIITVLNESDDFINEVKRFGEWSDSSLE